VSQDDISAAWRQIRRELQRSVTDSAWNIWLAPLEAKGREGATLLVEAPDAQRAWVRSNFARLLDACAAAALGPGATVRLVAPGEGESHAPSSFRGGDARPLAAGPAGVPPNPRLTFDQFVIGDANRLAHAAALAVAEMPGLAYNPLFVCGPPGLGKTHLLHAVANYVTAYGDGLTVRHTTAEAFTDQFVGALQSHTIERFKAAYRGVDVLLVDDVQFLQSKAKTETEFFHTFNALHASGAQLVLTSDRPPRNLDALEDRLRERFEAGLVAEVRPPDHAMRAAILRKRVQQDAITGVEDGALELIAARVDANIRALEGALIRVIAFGSLTGRPVSEALAEEVLRGLYPELTPRRRSIRDIQERICVEFGISVDELVSPSRAGNLAWPRQVAMYLARELTGATLPSIGREFGGRNHTTVLHACRRTAQRIAGDRQAYDTVQRLSEQLGQGG